MRASPSGDRAPLRAVDIARAFVQGADVRALSTGGGASVDAATLRASYAASEAVAQVADGYDFNAGFDPSRATWSLLGAVEGEKRGDARAETAATRADAEPSRTRMDGESEDAPRASASRRSTRRRGVETRRRAVRPRMSAASVMGVDKRSDADALARAWVAPEEKEMLQKWQEDVEGWRDDYKRKRRAALRLRKGTGATIVAL